MKCFIVVVILIDLYSASACQNLAILNQIQSMAMLVFQVFALVANNSLKI